MSDEASIPTKRPTEDFFDLEDRVDRLEELQCILDRECRMQKLALIKLDLALSRLLTEIGYTRT